MAMTKCKECGAQISTKTDACPNCGAKRKRTSPVGYLLGIVLRGAKRDDSEDVNPAKGTVDAKKLAEGEEAIAGPVKSFITKLQKKPRLFVPDVPKALAEIENAYVMAALVAALNNNDLKIRKAAIQGVEAIAIGGFDELPVEIRDDRIVGALTATLGDEEIDASIRKSAIGALGKLGRIDDARAVDVLIATLNTNDSEIRRSAMDALDIRELIGDVRIVEALVADLEDEKWNVQFRAASLLVEMFREGKIDEEHTHLILARVATIESVLPPERMEYLRDNDLWPFEVKKIGESKGLRIGDMVNIDSHVLGQCVVERIEADPDGRGDIAFVRSEKAAQPFEYECEPGDPTLYQFRSAQLEGMAKKSNKA